jgi:glutathione S-transferase
VLAVIDLQLERSGKEYLTGDEVSYVDLEFIPWNVSLAQLPNRRL